MPSLRPGKRLSLTALLSRNEELKALGGDEVEADAEELQAFRASMPVEQQALAGEAPSSSGPSSSNAASSGGPKRGPASSSSEPSPKRGLLSSMFGRA